MELPEPWGIIAVWGFVLPVVYLVSSALTNLVLRDFLILKARGPPLISTPALDRNPPYACSRVSIWQCSVARPQSAHATKGAWADASTLPRGGFGREGLEWRSRARAGPLPQLQHRELHVLWRHLHRQGQPHGEHRRLPRVQGAADLPRGGALGAGPGCSWSCTNSSDRFTVQSELVEEPPVRPWAADGLAYSHPEHPAALPGCACGAAAAQPRAAPAQRSLLAALCL